MFKRKTYRKLSDKELIDLYVLNRCTYTIPILYERYGHLVMGSCLKYLQQKENAEDITMGIFGDLGNLIVRHEIQYFKSWLYQVTRNECLQFLRKNGKKTTVFLEELATPVQLTDDNTIFESHTKEFDLQLLEKGIETLKNEQKRCVKLFYLEQQSYQQISEQSNLPLNTVKSAIQNGKRNLKIWMERHENKNSNY